MPDSPSPKRGFVRCLWGDDLIDRYPDRPYEVKACYEWQPRADPSVFVAFGQRNAEIAREVGWDVLQASEEAVVNLTGKADRNAKFWQGSWPYDITMYAHKFLAVAAALRAGWDEVVFLDMETVLIRPLPDDFWEVLRAGAKLQCPLYCYHNLRYCGHPRPRTVAAACAFYCRDPVVMDECLQISLQFQGPRYRKMLEEVHMRMWIDRQMGGWQSEEEYIKRGYQFPYHAKNRGFLIDPIVAVFGNKNMKGWSKLKKAGPKAWEDHVDQVLGDVS